MPVVVRRNFPRLDTVTLVTREDWRAVGELARERIIRRTVAGRDVQGQAFAPYSPGYALRKEREVGGVFSHSGYGQVTLQLSGEMLRAIQVEAFDDRVELSFVG